MSDNPLSPPDHGPEAPGDALAAEFALGLLDAAHAREARARMRTDPAFAAEVRGWHERLATLALDLPQVVPHYTVKSRIDAVLFTPAPSWRGRLRAWLAGGLAAAVIGIAALVIAPSLLRPAPDHVAQLSDAGAGLRVTTAFRMSAREIEVTVDQGAAPAGRDLELWWIGPDAVPVSLGLAPRSGRVRLQLPAGLVDAGGVTIALSLEPPGGSPTGQATGPVVASAPLTRL